MDNAFERARAAYGTGAYDDATLEFLFPQLKESRDEQIRKAIIKSLDMPFPEDNLPGTDVAYKEAVAWLEKQKELFESGKGLYYYDGEKTTYCGYPATEENPYDFAMSQQEKQKEQKPAEWSEEDEHYFQNLIMAVDSTFGDGNTKNWLQNRLKSLRTQPKQELSIEKAIQWLDDESKDKEDK